MSPECRPTKTREVDPLSDFPDAPQVEKKDVRESRRVDPFSQFEEPPSTANARERGRFWIALSLLVVFLVIVVLSFCLWPKEDIKELFHALMPSVTAFIGAAIGFYFGTEKKE